MSIFERTSVNYRVFLTSGKQRKTASSIRTKEKLNSQLTGPKPFPLERLLAIFYNIVEEQVTYYL